MKNNFWKIKKTVFLIFPRNPQDIVFLSHHKNGILEMSPLFSISQSPASTGPRPARECTESGEAREKEGELLFANVSWSFFPFDISWPKLLQWPIRSLSLISLLSHSYHSLSSSPIWANCRFALHTSLSFAFCTSRWPRKFGLGF